MLTLKVADTKVSGESDLAYAKKPGKLINVDDLKNVECYRCH